jgi:hypothetical protein
LFTLLGILREPAHRIRKVGPLGTSIDGRLQSQGKNEGASVLYLPRCVNEGYHRSKYSHHKHAVVCGILDLLNFREVSPLEMSAKATLLQDIENYPLSLSDDPPKNDRVGEADNEEEGTANGGTYALNYDALQY